MMRKKTLISEEIIKEKYIKRIELFDGDEFGCDDFEVSSAYTLSGDYIGDIDTAEYIIIKMEIVPEKKRPDINICTIGFCKAEQKYYGWSHRAMYGFGIGHTIKPGDCAYNPSSVDELYVKHCQWYGNKKIVENGKTVYVNNEPQAVCDYNNNCIIIEHKYVKKQRIDGAPIYIPDESELEEEMPVSFAATESYEEIYGEEGIHYEWVDAKSDFQRVYAGRGEWTAETLEDAKQMAIEYSDSVS